MLSNPKTRSSVRAWLCAWTCILLELQLLAGLPEPGLTLYGSISAVGSGSMPALTNLTWRVQNPQLGDLLSQSATLVSVNGQTFYRVYVPFETRLISGAAFPATPGTLSLPSTSAVLLRTVNVDGKDLTLLAPASTNFTFGPADRGRIDRVDLQYDTAVIAPGQDSDGDGMTDEAEIVAGTDPKDPKSVFKMDGDITVDDLGTLTVQWSSVAGREYRISRTSDLATPFVVLQTGILATPPLTLFRDSTAQGKGPFFYRVEVLGP